MSDDYIIYHNPRCSKSREALKILQEQGIVPVIIDYLKTPPTVEALRSLGLPARVLIRDNEDEYTELNLADPEKSDSELFSAIAEHPILLQRPIVIAGHRVVIARPPERVRELFQNDDPS